MADRHPLFQSQTSDNLVGAGVFAHQRFDLLPDRLTQTGLNLGATPRQRQAVRLLGPVAPQTPVAVQLPTDGRFVTAQQRGNLCLAIVGFLQDVNIGIVPLG